MTAFGAVTESEQREHQSAVLGETIGLLQPSFDWHEAEGGYIDVLGEDDPLGSHISQRVFHSNFLPYVYEHLWRRLFARVIFGLSWFRPAEERRVALEMLGITVGDRVLDVGCGPGNYTRPLAKAAGDGLVVGVDASAEMLASAVTKGGGENIAYVRGNASVLPFADGTFDAACCIGVIHMLEFPMRALDEMVRVLRPGGRLLVQATCKENEIARFDPPGLRLFHRKELTSALEERGMAEVRQRVVARAQFVSACKPAKQAA